MHFPKTNLNIFEAVAHGGVYVYARKAVASYRNYLLVVVVAVVGRGEWQMQATMIYCKIHGTPCTFTFPMNMLN
jgi:hypothetical protein